VWSIDKFSLSADRSFFYQRKYELIKNDSSKPELFQIARCVVQVPMRSHLFPWIREAFTQDQPQPVVLRYVRNLRAPLLYIAPAVVRKIQRPHSFICNCMCRNRSWLPSCRVASRYPLHWRISLPLAQPHYHVTIAVEKNSQ